MLILTFIMQWIQLLSAFGTYGMAERGFGMLTDIFFDPFIFPLFISDHFTRGADWQNAFTTIAAVIRQINRAFLS